MATRYTDTWDEATPVIGTVLGLWYQHMQYLKRMFRERMMAPQWGQSYRLKDYGAVVAGTVTLDFDDGDVFMIELPTAGTVTIQVSDVPSNVYDEKMATMITLFVKNPASGACTLAWGMTAVWNRGTEPVRDTTASYTSEYQLVTLDGGTKYVINLVNTGMNL